MTLRRIVLLRHGRTTWNAQQRMQGRLDPELDETGHRQAARAAPRMAALAPSLLVASDQQRAWRTAEMVGKAAFLTPRPEPRLRETALGEWEGLTGDEVEARWPGGLDTWRHDATWAPPGGESRRDVADRALPVIDELVTELTDRAADDDAGTAVLVAHGGTIIALTASLLGWPVAIWPTLYPLTNCGWATLEHRGGFWRLRTWNTTASEE